MAHLRRWPAKLLSDFPHIPVLADRVVHYLKGCPRGFLIDATLGTGGHLRKIYREYQDYFDYVGFDLDTESIEKASEIFYREGIKAKLIKCNFSEISKHIVEEGMFPVSAVLYDLGLSSLQIDNPDKGFSYLSNGPLRMTFDPERSTGAADFLKHCTEQELIVVLTEFGQEPKAKRLAKVIKANIENINSTGELAKLIKKLVGDKYFIKTAARVFQALRIKVNDELSHLKSSLESVIPMVQPAGRLLVISYHSLEDGITKDIFRLNSGRCLCPPRTIECTCGKKKILRIVTSKPERPSAAEIAANPRARSAKLRVAEKIAA